MSREGKIWYVHENGEQHGPYTEEELLNPDNRFASTLDPAIAEQEPGLSFLASLAVYALKDPLRGLRDFWQVLTHPISFAIEHVNPTKGATTRAVDFYITAVTLSVALIVLGGSFLNYSGLSEFRRLIALFIQIGAIIVPLHLLIRLLVPSITWRETLQCVLYADGAFILCVEFIGLGVAIIERMIIGKFSPLPDLFGNEMEACLSKNSWIYWLSRGQLTFKLVSADSYTNPFLGWLRVNYEYAVLLPFLFSFGRMIRAKKDGKWLPVSLLAFVAFFIANYGYQFAEARLRHTIALRSPCYATVPQLLTKRYRKDELLKYLDVRLNNQLQRVFGKESLFRNAKREGRYYVISLWRKPEIDKKTDDQELLKIVKPILIRQYCSGDLEFSVMRRIGQHLGVQVVSVEGKQLAAMTIAPRDCAKGQ